MAAFLQSLFSEKKINFICLEFHIQLNCDSKWVMKYSFWKMKGSTPNPEVLECLETGERKDRWNHVCPVIWCQPLSPAETIERNA